MPIMMPEWGMSLPWNIIHAKAQDFGLDSNLVAAIIWQESKGKIYATRYEYGYKHLFEPNRYLKLGNDLETEVCLQSCSYGLMQIMGATARWQGFDNYMPQLYRPDVNIYWGCKYLATLKNRWPTMADYVAAYNGGSPRKTDGKLEARLQKYVDSVFKFFHELQ